MGKRVDIPNSDEWRSGEDKIHRITVVDGAGASVNMGGWSLLYELKTNLTDLAAAALATYTAGSGIAVENNNGTDDRAVTTIPDTDTDTIDGKVWYTLTRTDDGDEGMLAYGLVDIRPMGLTS